MRDKVNASIIKARFIGTPLCCCQGSILIYLLC
ncbi:hypothetical protein VKUWNCZY_CDS0023 [Escherichia phage KS_A8]|nr:MAG TPA: hypothetical protein [Bacteriophage sp.]